MASVPITQQITADLRRQIQEGTLGPGALLPSEPELARAYGVSRQTARAAMQGLEREGLVIVRPRRGRLVRSAQRLRWHLSEFERPDHTILTTSDAWETDIESQGHDPTRQDLDVERIQPPPAIAQRLRLDPRTDVCVVRRHVRYIDGKPAIISDDFFDEQIVRGTELAEPEDTTRENILAEAGYEQVYDIDEIITRMPTPEETRRLGIAPGTPVAEHIRTGYTATDKPVRVMISIIPGDTLILQYTIPT
ncbi:GntR family transcriptional regulator [Trebonia sp.]|uniref:GntR family transcriptional regulator n=1 Tax=Trebonia sp. TaxID=2767075 RepID=UPI00262D5253|nr:GntR family transcriptional regulator [Trebonia sp.]